ncbi:MAG: HAMP domain-containing sensor histidine kinase [Pseudomonadota bacterium]
MASQSTLLAARGLIDDEDCLLSADDALAQLQESCGGVLPGTLAVPELLDLVQQSRRMGLRISREFAAFDGTERVSGFVRILPRLDEDGGGCEVLVENWQRSPMPEANSRAIAERLDAIDRSSAEVTARLDPQQRVQLVSASAQDAADLVDALQAEPLLLWTDCVDLKDVGHRQPLHWRLLDGAACQFEGSTRHWRARLLPLGPVSENPLGFELLLVADQPLPVAPDPLVQEAGDAAHARLIGSALAPALRQPLARIIANAETIRSRLAGPLRQEYSDYAGNIASAGQHLTGLLEDLAELEVVEAPDFTTESEPVDMADAARRAAGILGVRARARNIEIDLPIESDAHIAQGEFRRVLQILINLIGNAITYSPEHSTVTVRALSEPDTGTVSVVVGDQGPGIMRDQAERIFEKFERLGRDADGGSGLGLYISYRLAQSMRGGLSIDNPGEAGARFRLSLPRNPGS